MCSFQQVMITWRDIVTQVQIYPSSVEMIGRLSDVVKVKYFCLLLLRLTTNFRRYCCWATSGCLHGMLWGC